MKGEGWALVVLGSDGFFSAVSDYGNYAYIWTHPGCEFRRFLVGCDASYFWSKIVWGRPGSPRVFDAERTQKNIEKALWEMMGPHGIDKPQHDRALEMLEEYIDDEHEGIVRWADDLHGININPHEEGLVAVRPEPQSWGFATKILPRLQDVLRAELAEEQRTSGADVAQEM